MNLPDDVVLEIILNSDACTIVNLYNTDQQFRKMINDKNIFAILSEQYYQTINSVNDLVKMCLYKELVPDFQVRVTILKEELRTVERIKYRYYNDRD